jgi:hypothetical protein
MIGTRRSDCVRTRAAGDRVDVICCRFSSELQRAESNVDQERRCRDGLGRKSIDHTHYLRVHMNQLRQKIEPNPARPKCLITEPGVGYRLMTDD